MGHAPGHLVALAGREVGKGQPELGQHADEPVLFPVPEDFVKTLDRTSGTSQRTLRAVCKQAAEKRRSLVAAVAGAQQVAAEQHDQRLGVKLAVAEQQARRRTAKDGRAARRADQLPQPVMTQGPAIEVVTQRQGRLLQGVQCVQYFLFIRLRGPGQTGKQVAGPRVGGAGQLDDAAQVMGFQRLARDVQHQDLLDRPDQRDERPVLRHQSRRAARAARRCGDAGPSGRPPAAAAPRHRRGGPAPRFRPPRTARAPDRPPLPRASIRTATVSMSVDSVAGLQRYFQTSLMRSSR